MAFPQSILDLKAELNLNGTQTNITSYVYQRNGAVSISRGRPDESSSTNAAQANVEINNRDGRFSPRNPTGAYYGTIGRNTPIRLSVPSQNNYWRSETDSTSYVSTPDSAGLSITGDTEIQIDMKLSSYVATTLASKWKATGNQRSWILVLNANGTVTLFWSNDGSGSGSATSTVTLPMGRLALKVTLATATGTVKFFTASSISGSYTQLGDTVVSGARVVFDSTAPVWIGYQDDDFPANHSSNAVIGQVYGFKLISGIGGTTKAFADFTAQSAGASSFVDANSNTWTLNGTGEISNRNYRFHGEVPAWPQRWDVTGNDVYTPVQPAGLLRRLGQNKPLDSVMYRAVTKMTGSNAAVAYWPMEDSTAAGHFASALPNGSPLTISSGAPKLASDSNFICSSPIPVLNNASMNAPVFNAARNAAIQVICLIDIPSTPDTDGSLPLSFSTSGDVALVNLEYTQTSSGTLLASFQDNVGGVFETFTLSSMNGKTCLVRLSISTASGGNRTASMDVILENGTTTSQSASFASTVIGQVTSVRVNSNPAGAFANNIALGHVFVQNVIQSISTWVGPLEAWAGETAANRFIRLCGEEGVAYRIYGAPSNTRSMGPQSQKKLTDLLQECEDADAGMIYECRQALALGYRTRESMENQSATVTLSYTSADIGMDSSTSLEPIDDDLLTRNDVTVTRSNGTVTGASSRQVLTSGTLSNQAPPNGVGQYAVAPSVNLFTDSQVENQAGWLLHLGTIDEPRYSSIPLNLARTELTGNATKFYGIASVDQGDYVSITSPPSWLPPGSIKQIAAGFAEKLGGYTWTIEWQCIPESPYETAIAGSGATSDNRVDTDGTTTNTTLSTVDTSIGVTTTAQTAESINLWTTVAGDFPFDIMISGEQMTVTNITGGTSVQTFTVTRSVNGVVKTHSSGESVNVYDFAIVAMDDPN